MFLTGRMSDVSQIDSSVFSCWFDVFFSVFFLSTRMFDLASSASSSVLFLVAFLCMCCLCVYILYLFSQVIKAQTHPVTSNVHHLL